jgi:hypothetical protein
MKIAKPGKMRWTAHIARMEGRLNANYIWNAEGKRPLGRRIRRWENAKTNLKQYGRAWTGFV